MNAPAPTPPAKDAREAVASIIREHLELGHTWSDDDGMVNGEHTLADAILAALSEPSGERAAVERMRERAAIVAFLRSEAKTASWAQGHALGFFAGMIEDGRHLAALEPLTETGEG